MADAEAQVGRPGRIDRKLCSRASAAPIVADHPLIDSADNASASVAFTSASVALTSANVASTSANVAYTEPASTSDAVRTKLADAKLLLRHVL